MIKQAFDFSKAAIEDTKKKEAEEEMQQKKMTEQKSQQLLSARMKTIVGIRWAKKNAKKTAKATMTRVENSRGMCLIFNISVVSE
uniref:Uncharacterized protein n=1 Tax=Ditylenchus dipsaci TaxID=166011 RepID=A0A915DVA1_9BILA